MICHDSAFEAEPSTVRLSTPSLNSSDSGGSDAAPRSKKLNVGASPESTVGFLARFARSRYESAHCSDDVSLLVATPYC